MSRYQTDGIVLKRVNYGEADRILTLLTVDSGVVSVIAKGVRKPKSKLAGGIELFSVCHIGAIRGKRELDTLISTRLARHFEQIVKDYDRTQNAYEVLKIVEHVAHDELSNDLFNLVVDTLELLNDTNFDENISMSWFYAHVAKLLGSTPNLLEDVQGDKLSATRQYAFSVEDGAFFVSEHGSFGETEIKAWRVFVSSDQVQLKKISGLEKPAEQSLGPLKQFVEFHA